MAVDKDVGFWVAGVAAISAILTIAGSFIQKNNNTKEIAKIRKDMEADVGSQNAKIKENSDRINTMELAVISRIDKHEDTIEGNYMSRNEVDLKFDNLAQISTLQTEQILRVQEQQSVQIDNIFKLLTKMRDQQIEYLQSQKKD